MAPIRLLLAALVAAGLLAVGGASPASAQETIPTAEAQDFLGAWTFNVNTDVGDLTIRLELSDENGQVGASVSSELGGSETPRAIERIAREGESLVVNYVLDLMGMQSSVAITLSPEADGMTATLSSDGQPLGSAPATRG